MMAAEFKALVKQASRVYVWGPKYVFFRILKTEALKQARQVEEKGVDVSLDEFGSLWIG